MGADIVLKSDIDAFSAGSDGTGIIETRSVIAMAQNVVNATNMSGRIHEGQGRKLVGLTSMIPNNYRGATITPTAIGRPD